MLTGKILLGGTIETGSCPKEAKNLLQHGEWLKWLEDFKRTVGDGKLFPQFA
ncbi:DUF3102 domain-containing protein [Desulfosporosinus shakirovi]|uniref:DUF3102 domain-containing protein n=1 Tax=Desulfosporosinus shakirovi TaxID=2885154 RepID=UPI0028994CF0|nr:DUF3102 domain-containing protein [Desulfosporosinus sp. SRJS8]